MGKFWKWENYKNYPDPNTTLTTVNTVWWIFIYVYIHMLFKNKFGIILQIQFHSLFFFSKPCTVSISSSYYSSKCVIFP